MFPEMDSASKRGNNNITVEKYKVSPPQAIISTMDPQNQELTKVNEQKTQKQEESSNTRRQQLVNITSPDSLQQKKGSSRKKIKDFISVHKSRAAQSSRRAKSSRRKSNDLTPSEKTAAEKTDEKHSPSPGSSSSSKRRLLFFKKPSLRGSDRKQPPSSNRKIPSSSKSSKKNRGCRQPISMEKPITEHPMPQLDDDRPLQQMGVSHVVVKTKLDHKQLESIMRKRNQKYRFCSIVISLITAAIMIILMAINIVGIYKISEIYVLYGKEVAAKSWVDIQDWKMDPGDCLNLNPKSLMSRKGRLREETSTCERNLIPINNLPWTEWSECTNGKRFRYRKIEAHQESIALKFEDFAEIHNCSL
uniref:Uncharacterized protein n=1 Tax=Panagrolaimus sp. PS1159 TaxID=55785 RepID=A0AC35GLW4_9BILA